MTSQEKRARQKAARDAARLARERELRRRRVFRTIFSLVGVLVVLLVIVFTLAGNNDDSQDKTTPGAAKTPAQPTPQPTDTVAPPKKVACGGTKPPAAEPRRYSAPDQVLQKGVSYSAVIQTSCGDITVELDREAAPKTVNSFVFLAQEGFFDGLTFHRIVRDFVIQGGDPLGSGAGGPGYALPDELPARSDEYTFGALAMANSGPDTSGSQFFFVAHDPPELDAEGQIQGAYDPEPAGLQTLYSLFGRATEDSYATLVEISKIPTKGGSGLDKDRPTQAVYIDSITIKTTPGPSN